MANDRASMGAVPARVLLIPQGGAQAFAGPKEEVAARLLDAVGASLPPGPLRYRLRGPLAERPPAPSPAVVPVSRQSVSAAGLIRPLTSRPARGRASWSSWPNGAARESSAATESPSPGAGWSAARRRRRSPPNPGMSRSRASSRPRSSRRPGQGRRGQVRGDPLGGRGRRLRHPGPRVQGREGPRTPPRRAAPDRPRAVRGPHPGPLGPSSAAHGEPTRRHGRRGRRPGRSSGSRSTPSPIDLLRAPQGDPLPRPPWGGREVVRRVARPPLAGLPDGGCRARGDQPARHRRRRLGGAGREGDRGG